MMGSEVELFAKVERARICQMQTRQEVREEVGRDGATRKHVQGYYNPSYSSNEGELRFFTYEY